MKLNDVINNLKEEFIKGTYKCPECGTKVSKNSNYCFKCKKKVSEGDGDSQ
jgi:uncharacterized OB-fold protein